MLPAGVRQQLSVVSHLQRCSIECHLQQEGKDDYEASSEETSKQQKLVHYKRADHPLRIVIVVSASRVVGMDVVVLMQDVVGTGSSRAHKLCMFPLPNFGLDSL